MDASTESLLTWTMRVGDLLKRLDERWIEILSLPFGSPFSFKPSQSSANIKLKQLSKQSRTFDHKKELVLLSADTEPNV